MQSGEAWWKKSADGATGSPVASQAGVEARREAPSRDVDDESDLGSIGAVIDRAIGEFDAKIIRLKEELEDKRSEIKELESEIGLVEKDQAKAFKDLLGSNPQIKKLLNPKTKSKTMGRRKKVAPKRRDEPDNESLL